MSDTSTHQRVRELERQLRESALIAEKAAEMYDKVTDENVALRQRVADLESLTGAPGANCLP